LVKIPPYYLRRINNMRNWKRYLLIMMALGLFLAACSSPEPDAGTDSEPTAMPDEPDAEPTDEPVAMEDLECTDAIGCVEVAPGDPIRLASALVVTGPNESLGLDSQYGVEIAIKDRGEIMGHTVELQAEDDGCSAEGGQTAGQKIVSDPSIVGVVGTSCSGAGVPASQIICDAGIVMVSPSNTAPVLTDEATRQSCYFRTAHNDKIQGAAMATYVYDVLGIRKAAAIHDGDPYTEGLASVFRDSFTAMGGEIVAFEAEAADATNVEPLLTSVAAAGPELIYYPVFIPLGSLITKTAQEIDGLDGVVLAAADGVLSPDFLEASGDAAEGMFMSGPDLSFGNSIYDAFLATYLADYGTEPTAPFHAHAYDATNMILDAVASVAQMGSDGTLLIGRQALIDAVAATSGMDGITGTLTCDANGDCADPQIAVNQVQDGAFVPVWPDGDGAMMEDDSAMMDGEVMMVDELVCDDAIGCVEVRAGDPIRVASALVVTGPNESLGLDSQYGVEIAIGDYGMIGGHTVELQAEDDGCSAEGGQTAGQKIVSDPSIVAVVGTSCSGAGVPMSQIVCDAGIAMVSPSNTAPVLTGEGTRQACYFRTAHNDLIQGAAMANFVFSELGLTKVAAIHDGDPYTEGLATAFSDAFTALGGEIVAFEAEAADATNVEPLLTSVAAAGPELIYYPVFIPLGSLITKTAQEIDGLDGVLLAAADGVLSPDFLEASGDAAEGMYMSGPDLSFGNATYDAFLATYSANYGTEPTAPFHAHAYDATNIILDAIVHVATMDADGNMMIGRQALIDAIAATSGHIGITGTLTCDANGDCADPQIAVNQVQDGAFESIWAYEAE
jgi:branched-chain amino acid transport system substrate-binding protein